MVKASRLRCEYLVDPIGIDSPAPRLSWELGTGSPTRRGARQSAYRIVVTRDDGKTLWDSGRVASSASVQVPYAGPPLQPCARYRWKVQAWNEKGKAGEWSAPASWTMGLWAPGRYPGLREPGSRGLPPACWVGPGLNGTWSETESQPSPYLRKRFVLGGAPRRAVLFASALGVYEALINGSRVGESILAPEWTDYHTKVQYQGYDVTEVLREGENVLAAVLGPGWYAGQLGLGAHFMGIQRGFYGRLLRFAAFLLVELEAGGETVVVTDGSWKCTTEGPIRASDILGGETYDARRDMPGWAAPGFNETDWKPVAVSHGPVLVAQPNEPIRITQDIVPVKVTEPSPGTFIFDMGQNMVGWVRARLPGSAGTDVRIRHGEVLNPDGTLYRTNLRIVPDRPTWGAQQEDHYLCRGSGDECFEPHFTYHGFRYVEVSGLEKAPVPWDIVGRVLHSTSPEVGTLECSSPVLNRVLAAIQWTQRGNMQGVPTDCPQRDERLGWAGDIQVFSWTAMFNRDMAAFFTKWIRDLREGQAADGRLPDFAPHPYDPNARFSGNPGWSDAALLIPWRMYVAYGDREILAEAFEAASRWVEYSLRSNPDLIWRDQGACTPAYYGDWLNSDTFVDIPGLPRKGGEVPKEVYATAYFAYSASIAGKMAQVLGKTEEANRYTRLASRVRAAFLKEFVASDGKIKGDTQAGYALALHFDLLPAALRKKALARLVSALEPYRGGLSTGFLSTVPMMLELVRGGHVEEAYRLLLRREMPSWCYMVEHGGTTVWERWDGFVEGRGFQNPGMNSFNHYAIGSVGEWMWRVIAGINPLEEAPGCPTVRINPIPGGGLTWARASWRSIRGPLAIEWNRSAETFTMDVTIPPNMSAEIVLPGATAALTTESQTPLARAVGVSLKGRRAEGLVLQVGSGAYHFEADLKTAAPARTKAAVARAKRPAAPRRRKASAPPRRKR